MPVTGCLCLRLIKFSNVLNIRFVFASVSNSGPNSVFVFGRIVSSERIRILRLYNADSDVYGQLHSVSARCSHSDRLIWETIRRMTGSGPWLTDTAIQTATRI